MHSVSLECTHTLQITGVQLFPYDLTAPLFPVIQLLAQGSSRMPVMGRATLQLLNTVPSIT